jgi:hypothetical protein
MAGGQDALLPFDGDVNTIAAERVETRLWHICANLRENSFRVVRDSTRTRT